MLNFGFSFEPKSHGNPNYEPLTNDVITCFVSHAQATEAVSPGGKQLKFSFDQRWWVFYD